MSVLESYHTEITDMLQKGKQYQEVSDHLRGLGVQRGCSVGNIRRYCKDMGINPGANRIPNDVLDLHISNAVGEVGPSYGRRMMAGYMSAKGVRVAETRVGKALRETQPTYHHERQQRIRNHNSIPYYAAYYGHKLHLDQNEKLAMFGVTHVLAVDGYSSEIVKHCSMPRKNNLIIYENILRAASLDEGMWDTIRVDHGKEFYLSLYMQQKNEDKRYNTSRAAFIQSESKHNLRVERIWPEVNNRVNYPLKTALIQMVDNDQVEMSNHLHLYCISALTLKTAEIGMDRCVSAWNSHRISGRGVPKELKVNKHNPPVTDQDFPSADVAAGMYAHDGASSLTDPGPFTRSPFTSVERQLQSDAAFVQAVPDCSLLLNAAVNRNYVPFQNALLSLIDIVRNHSA